MIGVNFRSGVRRLAEELGIFGWVRNCEDGTVEIEAEGEEGKLRELLKWARRGPAWGRVGKVRYKWLDDKNEFEDFVIKY